jgi:hypothetical protein
MIVSIISPMDAVRLDAVSLDISQVAVRIIRCLKSNSLASKVSTQNVAFGTSKRNSAFLHVLCLVSMASIVRPESLVFSTSQLSAAAL